MLLNRKEVENGGREFFRFSFDDVQHEFNE